MNVHEQAHIDYIAVGGNRPASAGDWAPNLLAFGAGNSIALWNPDDERQNGVYALLAGHTDTVNAVKIYETPEEQLIISGSADKSIRLWKPTPNVYPYFKGAWTLHDHQGSVTNLSILPQKDLFISGSSDGTVKVWSISPDGPTLEQSISVKPRYVPLATAVTLLDDKQPVMAVSGTNQVIQLFARSSDRSTFELQATLTGHEGWIRSLDFADAAEAGDTLLASASQDKYIRLWRFSRRGMTAGLETNGEVHASTDATKTSLSNKAHRVGYDDQTYTVTFEALLIGHEDWVYTARWAKRTLKGSTPSLLSASADSSLAIWTADEMSGVWTCNTRLGEISAQKGSTTATGSSGGFWMGLWHPAAHSVVSLGRTGSWRRWNREPTDDMWRQQIGIGGHVREVQDLAWEPDGGYLLTTGSDQTTRLFAEWTREGVVSWHEMSRPQIHGYDLNCVEALHPNQFISGADEKLLRVFNKPKAIDTLLSKLTGVEGASSADLPDAANIPVLGLSNKAIAAAEDDGEPVNGAVNEEGGDWNDVDPASIIRKSTLNLDHPPLEDHLARHTLWPEHEKLYGHGYEISSAAASHNGTVVATACKASSIDQAVLRLFETRGWREIKPALTSHNLTVTSLAFSDDDRYLLSVGRDRQWTLYSREQDSAIHYAKCMNEPKAHSRMILGCAWAPNCGETYVFATAGRDRQVWLWSLSGNAFQRVASLTAPSAVTAIAFAPRRGDSGLWRLSYGTEDGRIAIACISSETGQVCSGPAFLHDALCPSGAVTKLDWRWRRCRNRASTAHDHRVDQLGVASEDGSVRVLNIGGMA